LRNILAHKKRAKGSFKTLINKINGVKQSVRPGPNDLNFLIFVNHEINERKIVLICQKKSCCRQTTTSDPQTASSVA
jgi:hypothetical protein